MKVILNYFLYICSFLKFPKNSSNDFDKQFCSKIETLCSSVLTLTQNSLSRSSGLFLKNLEKKYLYKVNECKRTYINTYI